MRTMRNLMLSFILTMTSSFALAVDDDSSKTHPLEVLAISSDSRLSPNVIVADKTKRKLSVFDRASLDTGTPRQQFDIDIGKNDGPKTKRDDKKTPEGIYILEKKRVPPDIPFDLYGSMAFTTNYPNFFDKFENKTGDGIWLHSVPNSVALTRGSKGCVILRNDAIKKVEDYISLNKTFILINDQINWLTQAEYQKEKEFAINWMNAWKAHWETQDLDSYIQNYSEEFSAPNFNKKSWLAHKKNLKSRYKFVKIQLSDPQIFHLKNQYIFQFVQDYESDGHKDTGLKTLYVFKEGVNLKIQREEWAELRQSLTAR
ncbi:MAG: L,D-transpeptidase family protein [Bdellovibrio sp.]|nr:L,D-transpeptidase family protein [Bdellovibrio sp.]